jgi:molecular chaperone GrpE
VTEQKPKPRAPKGRDPGLEATPGDKTGPPSPPPGTAPEAGTVPGTNRPQPSEADEPQERVDALERERDEYLDSLQRLKAEFDNFRKRTAREQESFAARANEALLREVLPILDDLERALEAAEQRKARIAAGQSPAASTHEEGEAKLEEGVRLVHRSLVEALRRQGLELIETDGRFDPHVHEALLAQPAEGAESGSVLQVLQKGYRLGDRVLRPARVVVAE